MWRSKIYVVNKGATPTVKYQLNVIAYDASLCDCQLRKGARVDGVYNEAKVSEVGVGIHSASR
jgi:hypothetical protein